MTWQIEEDAPQQSGGWIIEDAPASVKAGREINSIPRQLGLTARYALEGPAAAAQIFTEPLRVAQDKLFGTTSMPLGQVASKAADWLGLPSPQNANERTVGEAAKLMAGTGLFGGVARAASAAPGAIGYAGRVLSSNMGQQLGAAAGAGLSTGASKEAGGSPGMQFLAGLGGSVAGGLTAQAVAKGITAAGNTVRAMIPAQQQAMQQRIDQTINVSLQSQGIDPASITPAMRAALREEVGKAMQTGGPLNQQAVARLADYTRLGMTPTRARLTLDPYDVTQEANASKMAAATGSREARLPQIAQENNRRLVNMMDEMGGARPPDAYGQGNAAVGSVLSQDAGMRAGVDSLYRQARDTAGRPLPLDGHAFTARASYALDEAMVGGALPRDVENHLNRIARGEVPFTVDYAEQLKTRMNKLYGATQDGQTRMALGIVRRALDETPLLPAQQVNPGNLPAVAGTVPRSPVTVGQESIDAFNAARDAARNRFQWQDSSQGIRRAIDGAIPDTFIQQNILSKAAGVDDVRQLAQTINADPAARDAVRTAIVQHLKSAALGRGGTSETGNFSGRAVQAALSDIGDRKLSLFFDANEVETLKAMARTGAFEVFQPRGSAVNNSNTAAGLGSLLQWASKYAKPVANKLPLGEVVVSNPLDSLTLYTMQRPALNVSDSLLMQQAQRPPFAASLLLPGLAAGGLLSGTSRP